MSEKVSHFIIDYLIACFPAAAQMLDGQMSLPLHLACRFRNDFSIIKSLVEAWPDALRVPTNASRLPLHVACGDNKRTSLDIIHFLIEAYPAAVQMRDHETQLPLHLACENKLDSEIILCLVRAWTESVGQQVIVDGMGMYHYFSEIEMDSMTGETDDECDCSTDDDEQSSMDDEDETDNMETEVLLDSDEVDDENTITYDSDEQSSGDDDDSESWSKKQFHSLLPLDVSI